MCVFHIFWFSVMVIKRVAIGVFLLGSNMDNVASHE